MGWISTYERIHGKRDEDAEDPTIIMPLTFSAFANACVPPPRPDSATARGNRKIEIYFSDSSKTRREVITHVFKPLLGDIFAFNVVDSLFESLGIKDDSSYLLKVNIVFRNEKLRVIVQRVAQFLLFAWSVFWRMVHDIVHKRGSAERLLFAVFTHDTLATGKGDEGA